MLEHSLGIAAACLPILQPVLSNVSDITSTLFSRMRGTSQRSLRASSRKLHDQRSMKQTPEDRLYPLSNLEGTFTEVESTPGLSDADTEHLKNGAGMRPYTMINVERAYNVEFKSMV